MLTSGPLRYKTKVLADENLIQLSLGAGYLAQLNRDQEIVSTDVAADLKAAAAVMQPRQPSCLQLLQNMRPYPKPTPVRR